MAVKKSSRAAVLARSINDALKLDEGIRLGSDPYFEIHRVPTGSLVMDRITGGGFALGRHYELYGDECVVPETLVMTSEGDWIEAGELEVGDALVGFDEFPASGRGNTRMLRQASVIENRFIKRDCFRVFTDRGTETVASATHMWLRINGARKPVWKMTETLNVGDRISWLGSPYASEPLDTRDAGYLAGLCDGEGWMDNGRICAFCQRSGPILENGIRVLENLGFKVIVRLANGNQNPKWQPVYAVFIAGGMYEQMKFLKLIQPERFKHEAEFHWYGRSVSRKGKGTQEGDGWATIVEIEPVGKKEVCAVSTTTGTLVTDGLLSHNSVGKSYIVYRTMALSQARGNLCAVIDPEHSFDSERFIFLGGNPKELLIQHPQTAEDAIAVMMMLAQAAKEEQLEIVGIDSVASFLTTEEAEKDPREIDRVASQARMMSKALRRVNTVNKKTLFLWTNQERMDIGVKFGNPKTTSGGRALRYYATGRIEFRRGSKLLRKKKVVRAAKVVETDKQVGRWIQVKVVKDKSTIPEREGAFVFNHEMKKIDPGYEILQLGLEDELIERSGSGQYSYVDVDDHEWKGTEKRFIDYLNSNDELADELTAVIVDTTNHPDEDEEEE